MLDLDPQYVLAVKKILSDYIPDKTVWAYGSRVKGTAHAGSDLDLVVIDLEGDLLPAVLSALQAAFSESCLPISVDIFNWVDMPSEFQEEIKRVHEVLQAP